MREKEWHTYEMIVNGLPQKIRYNADTVEGLFLPLLRRLRELQRRSGRRCIVFLAAPPATGKSTIAQFLEQLSCTEEGLTPVQALGMDGFHYPNRYLAAHTILRDGEEIPLTSIKGAPETFDVPALAAKLSAAREERVTFPVYDRRIHDVVPDAVTADAPILRIDAAPELLRGRLIARKVQGGSTAEDAVAFYEASDAPNILRFAAHVGAADEIWRMTADGDFVRM